MTVLAALDTLPNTPSVGEELERHPVPAVAIVAGVVGLVVLLLLARRGEGRNKRRR
jgi:hypothetical protein